MNYQKWIERLISSIFKIYKCYSHQTEGDTFFLVSFPRFEIYVLSIDKLNTYLFYRDYEAGESHEFSLYNNGHYNTMYPIIGELYRLLQFKNLTFEDCIATHIKLNIETTGVMYDEGKSLFVWKPLMMINHNKPKHLHYLENFVNGPGWIIIRSMKEIRRLCSDSAVRTIQRAWRRYCSRREWALQVIEEFALRPNHLLYKKVMSRYINLCGS
jgi:hypothetical protein